MTRQTSIKRITRSKTKNVKSEPAKAYTPSFKYLEGLTTKILNLLQEHKNLLKNMEILYQKASKGKISSKDYDTELTKLENEINTKSDIICKSVHTLASIFSGEENEHMKYDILIFDNSVSKRNMLNQLYRNSFIHQKPQS